MALPTALLYDERYLEHLTGGHHPERPERVGAVWQHLQTCDFFSSLKLLRPEPAPLEWIEKNHRPAYVESVRAYCERLAEGDVQLIDGQDTAVCRRSYEIALLAAGGVLRLVDALFGGEARNGFGLLRPPGHHAEPDRSLGFCLFNNVAVGARYAQAKYGVSRVLIVDWDVHHGNGTQSSFEKDPGVFYFSLHQYPYYPGTGHSWEKGTHEGYGKTLNIPLPGGSSDWEYFEHFEKNFLPKAREFKPELLFISAGFDAHRDDPLAGMNLTEEVYGRMTAALKELARETAGERIVSVLEGGYNLEALSRSIELHLRTLIT